MRPWSHGPVRPPCGFPDRHSPVILRPTYTVTTFRPWPAMARDRHTSQERIPLTMKRRTSETGQIPRSCRSSGACSRSTARPPVLSAPDTSGGRYRGCPAWSLGPRRGPRRPRPPPAPAPCRTPAPPRRRRPRRHRPPVRRDRRPRDLRPRTRPGRVHVHDRDLVQADGPGPTATTGRRRRHRRAARDQGHGRRRDGRQQGHRTTSSASTASGACWRPTSKTPSTAATIRSSV